MQHLRQLTLAKVTVLSQISDVWKLHTAVPPNIIMRICEKDIDFYLYTDKIESASTIALLHFAAAQENTTMIVRRAKMENEEKKTKFCPHCGEKIDEDCVVCPKCGKQVQQLQTPNIVINNTNQNVNTNVAAAGPKPKNKWVAFLLCLFLGFFGAHKFYEGKILMGVLYIFTLGLLGIGWVVDLILILLKPNPYYV